MNDNAVQSLIERLISLDHICEELMSMGLDRDSAREMSEEIYDFITSSDENIQFIRILMNDLENDSEDEDTYDEDEDTDGSSWI